MTIIRAAITRGVTPASTAESDVSPPLIAPHHHHGNLPLIVTLPRVQIHLPEHRTTTPLADPPPRDVDDGGTDQKRDEEEELGSGSVDGVLRGGNMDWIDIDYGGADRKRDEEDDLQRSSIEEGRVSRPQAGSDDVMVDEGDGHDPVEIRPHRGQ
jgi:hypothetical protein